MEEAYACSLGSSSACSHMSSQAAAAPPPTRLRNYNKVHGNLRPAGPTPPSRGAEQMNSLQGR